MPPICCRSVSNRSEKGSTDVLENEAQENEPKVAVDRLRSRRIRKGVTDRALECGASLEFSVERQVRRQPAAMSQEIADGDRGAAVFVSPARDVGRNWIVEAQAAAFDPLHDQRRRRQDFRQRREVEHRVFTRVRSLNIQGKMPEGLAPEWPVRGTTSTTAAGKALTVTARSSTCRAPANECATARAYRGPPAPAACTPDGASKTDANTPSAESSTAPVERL